MVNTKKLFNEILILTAVAAGGYTLIKGLSNNSTDTTEEGSLGGNEEIYGEDFFDGEFNDNIGIQSIIDPNTIPEQPSGIDPYIPYIPLGVDPYISQIPKIGDTSPSSPIIKDFEGAKNPNYNDHKTTPSNIFTGMFGNTNPISAVALTAGSFLPTVFTSYGKLGISKPYNVGTSFKKVLPDAVEETPFVGKKLKDFAFKQSNEITEVGSKTIGSEIAQVGIKKGSTSLLKNFFKKIGTLGVKVIPFAGVFAGGEIDHLSGYPRWLTYPTNAVGDIVGGTLAVVTAPAVVTGIGTTVPIVAGVGGQVATELTVYGVYDFITGKNKNIKQETITHNSIYEDENENLQKFIGVDYNSSSAPLSVFSLNRGTKNRSRSSSSSSKSSYNPTSIIFSSVQNTQSPTLFTKSKRSKRSKKKSNGINTSRFVKQSGGGYSDTVAKQSVSATIAKSRSSKYYGTSLKKSYSKT